MHFRNHLTASTLFAIIALPHSALAQEASTDDEDEIVIQGQRRGGVIGNVKPIESLDAGDIRATGANSIQELLDALSVQLGTAQGRGGERPILLLNGRRISGFRELRDIPVEAIERLDILPEEVALSYGYAATQKVANIVLRERFRATTAIAEANTATDGGYAGGEADLTRLMIGSNGRTSVNFHVEGNGNLTEAERDVVADPRQAEILGPDYQRARTLLPTGRQARGAITVNRELAPGLAGTLNVEAEHDEGRSLLGIGPTILERLDRNTTSDSLHLGGVLAGAQSGWQWSVVGNGDWDRDTSRTDRDRLSNALDRNREIQVSGDLSGLANRRLLALPGGDVGLSLEAGGEVLSLDSRRTVSGQAMATNLDRRIARGAASLDVPISSTRKDFNALGDLRLNGNAEVRHVSDFGTLARIGAGASWSPVRPVNFIASWTREDGAPGLKQLGSPIVETPNARLFDFVTGETVLATVLSGGNPGLRPDRRNVTKLAARLQPVKDIDARLGAEYVATRTERPIRNISGTSAVLEAAFPERFVRDEAGNLLSADLRPVNFRSARKDVLRLSFDYSKRLKSKRPSQDVMNQMRAQWRGGQSETPPAGPPASDPQSSGGPPPGMSRGGGGGFGSGGRIGFNLSDTLTLRDKVDIGSGLGGLDYLNGDSIGSSGGTPRHNFEARLFWTNNGLGTRLSLNHQSATDVRTNVNGQLHFSPLTTVDWRAWANLGQKPELLVKHPWMRGLTLRLAVQNIFNRKPEVRDASGQVPSRYQSDLIDPLGRTLSFTIRKVFLPPPGQLRREREQAERGEQE